MKKLDSFQNIHQHKSIVVCGCGESLNDFNSFERFITIGVNDVGRKFQPNYLVAVNPRHQFSGDRFSFVESSQAEYIFTQLDLNLRYKQVVKFKLGTLGGTDFFNPNCLDYTNNSPYIALNLAILMGAKRIGLIGVDFTDNHFFAQSGTHPLSTQFEAINSQYANLAKAAELADIEIYNLSEISRLTAFQKISINEFEKFAAVETKKTSSLKIVSYATTPIAGVPAILARCINAQTDFSARCVWATNDYGNGVSFTGDVEWNKTSQTAETLLDEADIIVVHNGKVAREHEKLFNNKAVITMAHNYLWNVDQRFVKKGFPGLVIGQYQAVLDEFKKWSVVPNPLPFWEKEYISERKNSEISICYTPSGKHEKYPLNHKLYWHSKGYESTMRILDKLSEIYPIKLEVIRNGQISHTESLAMKMRSHIVIDECVTGSYHRNSLEGLSGGCIVVNGLGILPKVNDMLRICSDSDEIPFFPATLENLENQLTGLIDGGHESLFEGGKKNRQWLENNWNFAKQWNRFWIPAIQNSLHLVNRKMTINLTENSALSISKTGKVMENVNNTCFKNGVSIVIPHGGQNRLPHLRSTLANLRQCKEVVEIIVVEMDKKPSAIEVARRWADKYYFLECHDSFERAKTLNTGSSFAECELIMWMDNDLLIPHDFVSLSAAEMLSKKLDFLIPFSEIKYLSFNDSEKVMQGILNPIECSSIKTYTNTMTDGGIGLIRNDFLHKVGGIPTGFHGWGGEDNAWMHKANLFGKAGRTTSKRPAFHLYHALSGGNSGNAHILANPHYENNLKTLGKIKKITGIDEFIKEFPPVKIKLCNHAVTVWLISNDLKSNPFTAINDLFTVTIEIYSSSEAKNRLNNPNPENSPSAIIFFDNETAEKFINKDFFRHYLQKTIVISKTNQTKFQEVFAVLTTSPTLSGNNWYFNSEDINNYKKLETLLAQPLSILLNNRESFVETKPETTVRRNSNNLPVWFYWEGNRPKWIEFCHQTIAAKSPEARFLTPETFAEIWTEDLDIDVSHLYVAHRADFIRAYLLAKFGGIWVDADCVVMKDLSTLLNKLEQYDFIAHRERSGYYSNCLMAAKKDSVIAGEFYNRVCNFLRANKRLSWLEIGSQPLTEILEKTNVTFLELDCEQIQPICWSQPEKFFAIGNNSEHEQNFDKNALCYMLSNGAVINYQSKNPTADLTAENSFFRFVVQKSLSKINPIKDKPNDTSSPKSTNINNLKSVSFYLDIIKKVAPQKIIDTDVGLGTRAVLVREFFEPSAAKKDWRINIEAIIEAKPENSDYLESIYDRIHTGSLEKSFKHLTEKQDLVIFGDSLSLNGIVQSLQNALNVCDYILLTNYRQKDNNYNYSTEVNNLQNYIAKNPDQIAAFHSSGNKISFLLSQNDPKNIRKKNRLSEVLQIYPAKSCESISGPGCSLEATKEIRRGLPLLFSSLNINSMLDAKCGDYNWMKHSDFKLEQYIGVDVFQSVIEQNNEHFAGYNKKFIVADITQDFLPQCDLILCRDCLVHFSFEDIFSAFRNFYLSGAKFLLTTTFPKIKNNPDIKTGNWRALNLQLPPFNFPEPIKLINEHCIEGNGKFADKSLGLWKFADIYTFFGFENENLQEFF